MATANRTTAEWDRRMKELKRKKMLQKQQARECGEEIDSDDDDEEEFDEVVADVEWDVLEGEDTLTGTHLSTQGPFSFHARGSESVRPAETGQTIGPSSGLVGAGGYTTMPGVPTERGGPVAMPLEAREMSPSARE